MRLKIIVLVLFCCTHCYSQQTVGTFLNDSLAFNGYTLIAPAFSTSTYLIDNCGNVVNEWTSEYVPGASAYLLEDGRLLRTGKIVSPHFLGGGVGGHLEIKDWDDNMVWQINYADSLKHQHHDIEYLPNGNILILAWEKRSEMDAIENGRIPDTFQSTLWPEQIVEITPIDTNDYEIVWEWHLWDHLIQDYDTEKLNFGSVKNHPELVDVNAFSSEDELLGGVSDWIHANSIDYNPALDQIMICSRTFSEFWVIDHSTTTAEAATHSGGNSGKGGDLLYRWGNPSIYKRGTADDQKLFRPHDAQWIEPGLPNEGNILIFNNGVHRPIEEYSSVDIISPPVDNMGIYLMELDSAFGPDELLWSYQSTPPSDFFSRNRSGAQQLPNGNILICDNFKGRFFEVDEIGTVHWDYVNPVMINGITTQGNDPGTNAIFRVTRYAPDYPALVDKDLTPGSPIELEPLPNDCDIFTPTTQIPNSDLSVFPNPFKEELFIQFEDDVLKNVIIVNVLGNPIFQKKKIQNQLIINTENWSKGIYFIKINNNSPQKIIKQSN